MAEKPPHRRRSFSLLSGCGFPLTQNSRVSYDTARSFCFQANEETMFVVLAKDNNEASLPSNSECKRLVANRRVGIPSWFTVGVLTP